jgi:hypothetical protein
METWKDIRGYEGLYQVSNLGRIRSLGRVCNAKNNSTSKKRERILTQEITVFGYCRVRLFDLEGKSKHYATHRIVAQEFIGNIDGYEINHKNEIKTDNRVENLEIVTSKQNCNYGTRNKRLSEKNTANKALWCKGVVQKDNDGNVIAEYESRLEAERKTGISNSSISKTCNGKKRTANGFIWENKT